MLSPRLVAALSILRLLAVAGSTEPAGQRNVTIDDQYGDEITHLVPTFMPLDGWNLGGTGGFAKPNASLAYNETWRDSTQHIGDVTRTVNFGFTGVSLYVYCIIANTPPGPAFDAFANYQFLLDGDFVGRYTHDAERTQDYFYNTSVYVNTTMENEFHNFSIVVDPTEKPVLLLFDYAVYTIEEKPPTPSASTTNSPEASDTPEAHSNAGVVVGSTLGAVALAFCVRMLLPVAYL